MRQAEAELASSEAELAQQEASLKLALFDRDAYTRLAETGAASERQGKHATATAEQQTAVVAAAKRRVEAVQGALITARANLAAPAGATSAGLLALGTVAVDVVTGITKLNASGLSLSYQLDATTAAGVISSTTRVVTYTITGGV